MIDWRHWHNEPHLVGGLILLGWLYALCTGPWRGRIAPGEKYPRWAAVRFYASLVIFYLAVGSPLDQIGERFLLSAHMVQHQLLIYIAAPLFLGGLPAWLVDAALDRRGVRGAAAFLLRPVACAFVYVLVLSIWHAPAFYEAALENKRVHILQHVMFFGAALFYWWPILSGSRVAPAARHGGKIVYALAVTIGMTPVFAFIAFSGNVLYPMYEYAPRFFAGLSPQEDQLLAAGIMKLGDMGMTILVSAIAFYAWYLEGEKVVGENAGAQY